MNFNISKNQILELLKSTMKFNMSYDGQSWLRGINYDLQKITNSDIGKQVFTGEVGQLGILTYFSQNWGISDVDIKGIANELMMKSKYLDRITFENEMSRKKYLSELVRLGEVKSETNQPINIPTESSIIQNSIIDDLIKQVDVSSRATIKGRPTCDIFGDVILLKYDNYRLVENDIMETMARMKKIKESGVSFASILDYRITSTNEKGKSTGYVMQEKAPGTVVFDDIDDSSIQNYRNAITSFSNIPQIHFDKLVKDFVELMKQGLSIDTGNPANFFYDKEKGFTFIDLQSFKGENLLEDEYSRQALSQNISSIFFDKYNSSKTPDNEFEQLTDNAQKLLMKLKVALEKIGVTEQEFRHGAAEINDKFIRTVFTRQRQSMNSQQSSSSFMDSNKNYSEAEVQEYINEIWNYIYGTEEYKIIDHKTRMMIHIQLNSTIRQKLKGIERGKKFSEKYIKFLLDIETKKAKGIQAQKTSDTIPDGDVKIGMGNNDKSINRPRIAKSILKEKTANIENVMPKNFNVNQSNQREQTSPIEETRTTSSGKIDLLKTAKIDLLEIQRQMALNQPNDLLGNNSELVEEYEEEQDHGMSM